MKHFALPTPALVEPKGPLLRLEATLSFLLLEMPDEKSPDSVGGILLPPGHQAKFSPYAVVRVLSVGPDAKSVKVGQRVLVQRGQVDQVFHDQRSYWRATEHAVIGIVQE